MGAPSWTLILEVRDGTIAAMVLPPLAGASQLPRPIDVVDPRTGSTLHDDAVFVESSGNLTAYALWTAALTDRPLPAKAKLFFQLGQLLGVTHADATALLAKSATAWYSAAAAKEKKDTSGFADVCLGNRCVSVTAAYAALFRHIASLAAATVGVTPAVFQARSKVWLKLRSGATVRCRLHLLRIADAAGMTVVAIDAATHVSLPVEEDNSATRLPSVLTVFVDSNSLTATVTNEDGDVAVGTAATGEMSVVRCLVRHAHTGLAALSALAAKAPSGLPAKRFVDKLLAAVRRVAETGDAQTVHADGESAVVSAADVEACAEGLQRMARSAVRGALDGMASSTFVEEAVLRHMHVVGQGAPQQLARLATMLQAHVLEKHPRRGKILAHGATIVANTALRHPMLANLQPASLLPPGQRVSHLGSKLELGTPTEVIDFDGDVLMGEPVLPVRPRTGPWFKIDVAKPIIFQETTTTTTSHGDASPTKRFAFAATVARCTTDQTSVKRGDGTKATLHLAKVRVVMLDNWVPVLEAPCVEVTYSGTS